VVQPQIVVDLMAEAVLLVVEQQLKHQSQADDHVAG
jgi:hypothetical protein